MKIRVKIPSGVLVPEPLQTPALLVLRFSVPFSISGTEVVSPAYLKAGLEHW